MYADGTVYDGYWKRNFREGYGELRRPNGYMYKGFWTEDLKNGKGVMISAEGERIKAKWEMDRIHGAGWYKQAGEEEKLTTFWSQDLMVIDSNQNPDNYDRYLLNVGLNLGFWLLLFLVFYLPSLEVFLAIPCLLLYMAQMVETVFSSFTFSSLRNLQSVEKFEDEFEALKKEAPSVSFHLKNYHFDSKMQNINVQSGSGKWERRKEHVAHRIDSETVVDPFRYS